MLYVNGFDFDRDIEQMTLDFFGVDDPDDIAFECFIYQMEDMDRVYTAQSAALAVYDSLMNGREFNPQHSHFLVSRSGELYSFQEGMPASYLNELIRLCA